MGSRIQSDLGIWIHLADMGGLSSRICQVEIPRGILMRGVSPANARHARTRCHRLVYQLQLVLRLDEQATLSPAGPVPCAYRRTKHSYGAITVQLPVYAQLAKVLASQRCCLSFLLPTSLADECPAHTLPQLGMANRPTSERPWYFS